MKMISIVTPCYNEEANVEDVYLQVKNIFSGLPQYKYEHIFIDNCSKDSTVEILKKLARNDKNVKIIVNSRNFGHIRSPYHALLQIHGDAGVILASDLQDPPKLINDFIKKWEEGAKIVVGVKQGSKENRFMFMIRKLFYSIIARISDTDQIKNFTGFGLYDKVFIDVLRGLDDPYPYFRGLIAEIGFDRAEVPYLQPRREKGTTKNRLYDLYDMAMLGFVSHSKLPLRLASFVGFSVSSVSVLIALIYLIYKLLFWSKFQLGMAPLIIGIFFFSGVQLFFLGIIGEYIGSIFTQVKKRPLVIEKERVNF